MRARLRFLLATGPVAIAALLMALPALAARYATVDGVNVELRKGPGDQYDVIGHLKKGVRIVVSNYPTEGYYKARTAERKYGWVRADILILEPIPKASPSPDAGSESSTPPTNSLPPSDEGPVNVE